jgi:hypothetical protein
MGAEDSWATTTRALRNKAAARHAARNIGRFAQRTLVCTSRIISIWMRAERRRQPGRSRDAKSLPQIALDFRNTDTLVCVVFLVVKL